MEAIVLGRGKMNDLLTDEQMAAIRQEAAICGSARLSKLLAHHDAMMAEIVKQIKNEIIESRGMEGTIRAFAHQNCLRIIADVKKTK